MEIGPKAWLLLAKENRQHGGNLGYDDNAAEYYSWDSTVPNHSEVKVGDRVAIWDGETLLGASAIQKIDVSHSSKTRLRCPGCAMTKIKKRSQSLLAYRCHNQTCKLEFDTPVEESIEVTTYRSQHSDLWYDLFEELDAKALRLACVQPKAQFSMRLLDWQKFENSLATPLRYQTNNINSFCTKKGGHRTAKTRVRLGQAEFRKKMLQKFGNVCAISGTAHLKGLDAAHLYSYAELGHHDYHGGLLLRKDLHRFFDLGLIAIEPNSLKIQLADSLQAIPQYSLLQGNYLAVNINKKTTEWLKAHWMEHGKSLTEK